MSLAKRGTPTQTAFAHELCLHEYPWPRLLGEDRAKWERVAALVDKAARHEHQRGCSGSDGRKSYGPGPFSGDHAENHRSRIRLALVALLEAGLPRFLTEPATRAEAAVLAEGETT